MIQDAGYKMDMIPAVILSWIYGRGEAKRGMECARVKGEG
jgi:hypothetical protein